MQYRSTSEADRAAETRALGHGITLGLVASVALAAVATLAPFQLALPKAFCVDTELRTSDVLLNLALLAPLGLLLEMRGRLQGRRGVALGDAMAIGAGLSMLLELLQLFVPLRCSSPIDVVANAAGCGLGAVLHAQIGGGAERAMLAFLRSTPSAGRVVVLAGVLGWLAVSPLRLRLMHATFQWTLGPASIGYGPQQIVIGLVASLGLAAWLGFTLRMRARSVLVSTASALVMVAAIEVCRGYSMRHEASLLTLALAAVCALVSAHAAGRIAGIAGAQSARRVWV